MDSKEVVKKFFEDMRGDEQPKTIYLYTHNKRDGLGDAGQLGYLFDYLNLFIQEYNIQECISLISYGGTPADQEKISELARIMSEEYIWEEEDENAGYGINSYFRDKTIEVNEYLIIYPCTLRAGLKLNIRIPSTKLLQIYEMNLGEVNIKLATGICNDGIGYGIPWWGPGRKRSKQKIWLVSLKKYLGAAGIGTDSQKDRLKLFANTFQAAKASHVDYLIYITNAADIKIINQKVKVPWLNLLTTLPQQCLREQMDYIQDGLIISGGEGMFAESLGSHNNVPCLLCARYNYQYKEIFETLYSISTCYITFPYTQEHYSKLELYRFFLLKNGEQKFCCYYDNGKFLDIYNSMTEIGVSANTELQTSVELSAFFLPFSLNQLNYNIQIPDILNGHHMSPYEIALSIFERMRVLLSKSRNNWFHIIKKTSS